MTHGVARERGNLAPQILYIRPNWFWMPTILLTRHLAR
jgi:hypothetical protein